MTRRGQVQYVFLYILAALIILALFLFGYTTMSKLSDLDKRSSIESFESSLEERVLRVSPSAGTEELGTFILGHGLTRIFIVDTEKDVLPYFKGSSVINNSIKSGARRNVFIFSGSRLESSFFLEGMEIDFPYYLCTDIVGTGFILGFRGTGDSAVLRNTEFFHDCGIRALIREIVSVLYPGEDKEKRTEEFIREIELAVRAMREKRMIERDLVRNETRVTVTFEALEDLDRYRHIEIIAKCLAHDVSLVDFEGNPPDTVIREDPLIMWEFRDIRKGDTFSIEYSVEKLIDELCMREIQSLRSSVSGSMGTEVTTVAPDVTPPVVTIIGPLDGSQLAGTMVTYRFSVSDASGIEGCALMRDGIEVLYDPVVQADTEQSFIEGSLPLGLHEWSVSCADSEGNEGTGGTWSFSVTGEDITPPAVTLVSPSQGEVIDEAPAIIVYKAADSESGIGSCSLFRDGEWIMTDSTVTPGVPQKFYIAMAPGPYTIKVTCKDDSPSGNEAMSEEVAFTYDISAHT